MEIIESEKFRDMGLFYELAKKICGKIGKRKFLREAA